MEELIVNLDDEQALTIQFNRPNQKNALSKSLLIKLRETIANADNCKSITLTGSESCFSAGADFNDLTGTIEDIQFDTLVSDVITAIYESSIPVTAFVCGPCIGAAADITLNCKHRIVSKNAYFLIPAVQHNLLYNPASIKRMHDSFPHEALVRLLVLSEKLNAHEAYHYGLATKLDPIDETQIKATVSDLKIPSNLNHAATKTMELLTALEDQKFDLQHWNDIREDILSSPERLEAIKKMKSSIES